jgi:pilus assembly protein CpaF
MSLRGSWDDGLLTALGAILPLLEDDDITDIEANGFDDIWAKGHGWRGHRKIEGVGWKDREDFQVCCIRISDVIGRSLSTRTPVLDARLPGGERVNIAIPPACERIALTIRKFPAETMTFDRLVQLGSANGTIARMCEALVLARRSIIVAGGTGAGKTSLLNALTRFIPKNERIVTIEDARELQIGQPNWVSMESVEPTAGEGRALGIGDLVRNALRQTPDRIIVGEVRWDDALHLLRAFSTGHGGGFGTLHANDAVDALNQLQLLAQMAPIGGLTAAVVSALVARAVDVVIYQKLFEDEGKRRIAEIVELEQPGVAATPTGLEYRVRRLALWSQEHGAWTFPSMPSDRLLTTLRRLQLRWPVEAAS